MREIKFRGKCLKTNEWVFGYYGKTENQNHYIDSYSIINGVKSKLHTIVDPNTVGEYTELKDRNGKEIFEGDIISDIKVDLWSKVVYLTGQFYPLFDVSLRLRKDFEIIGNIHDNPDLWGSR